MEDAYLFTGDEVVEKLGTDLRQGLPADEISKRQKQYGKNTLPPPEKSSLLRLIIKQFEDLLVLILLGSACVSLLLGFLEHSDSLVEAFIEPSVIMLILIANAIVGVLQETNAEDAIEALKEYESKTAEVVRGGKVIEIPAEDLVPGDVVKLNVGAKCPADCRVVTLHSTTVGVDQSMLTGETDTRWKSVEPIIVNGGKAVDQDKVNIAFSGTLLTRGHATGVVVLTGGATSMGKISRSLDDDDEEKTPLQQKLDVFAEQLSKVILAICIAVWLININHFTDPEHGSLFKGAVYYFKIAVALAVAAIPEGLPAVVTTCLALGTTKMAKKNAIVRTLPSVETLGCTTVICSDKTGTLTTNKMSVQKMLVVDSVERGRRGKYRSFAIAGDSFTPIGEVTDIESTQTVELPAAKFPGVALISKISVLCNESHLQYTNSNGEDQFSKTGEATEAALKVLAEKCLAPEGDLAREVLQSGDPSIRVHAVNNYWNERFTREHLLEFDRGRKSMGVVVSDGSGARYLLVKGSPEDVLSRCSTLYCQESGAVSNLTASLRTEIEARQADFASKGLRVLACAYVDDPQFDEADVRDSSKYAEIESNMTFVGLVGMLDPPRAEVRDSILKCNQAGIRVVVITGDHKTTAEAISRRIGVFGEGEDLTGQSFTGKEFMSLDLEGQKDAVRNASLFSRVEPAHKKRICDLLQGFGEVVAMTGDGVNDAPALKKADIGVAMGSGTAVARQASDMILQDDNFATIVMAVEEGRAIYQNTKQFIRYLISSNIGEVVCIFLTAAIGMPEALIPVQLLWVNLVTDGLPATALGFNKPDSDIMTQPPRGRQDRIIDGWMFFRYAFIGLYIGVGTCYGFIWWFLTYKDGPQITWSQLTSFHSCSDTNPAFAGIDCNIFHSASASTVSLSVLVLIEMFNTFNALSENQSLFVVKPWSNPLVGGAVALSVALHCVILYIPFFTDIFHTAPLNYDEWVAVVAISFPVIILDEGLKFLTRYVVPSKVKKD